VTIVVPHGNCVEKNAAMRAQGATLIEVGDDYQAAREHADAVLRRLEIEHHFDDVFDIRAAELEPKPQPVVYERFLARHDVDPNKAAIFEDLARNLEVPHALGMTTVLVVPQGARVVLREEWELAGRDAPHVDHVTDDLAGFLRGIAQT